MLKVWFFIICLLIAGCAQVEKKGASLFPFEITYETPVPVLMENGSYEQKNSSFVSAFQWNNNTIEMNVSNNTKQEVIDVSKWDNSSDKMEWMTYGVVLSQGQMYEVVLEISNTIADKVEIIVDDYVNILHQKTFDVSEGLNNICFTFTHSGPSVHDAHLQISFSKHNTKESGQIVIEQLKLDCVSLDESNVKINQLGYLPESQKLAIFRYNAGDWFDVVNVHTSQVVYTGQIVGRTENADAGEINYYGDFSSVTEPGTYRIETQFGAQSMEFEIQEKLYQPLLEDALKMITLQRCGTALSDELAKEFAHEACHDWPARGYSSWEDMDVSGGWHDAGDYGRYTLTAVKTMNDLMLAYVLYPESFTDAMGLPESGNGLPDVLDEANVGLEWLRKMQNSWGGVYTAAVTERFAEFVSPENDIQQLWVLNDENTSTAAASGAFALASLVFQDIDASLSQEYLLCALKAYETAIALRGQEDQKNPKEINAGDYFNPSDEDEIYFAASMLYVLTHEDQYFEEIAHALNASVSLFGLSYNDFSGYGTYFLLKDAEFKKTNLYPVLYNQAMDHAQSLVSDNVNDGYHLTINSYHWGANMDVCNNAMMMLLINDVQPSSDLKNAAFEQLCYLLGKNSLNTSFITGYGKVYPQNIHHRIAVYRQAELFGALVGGPDGSADASVPPAKKYWDSSDSYSTNEVAIYYNSPLIFMLGAFQ